MLVEGREGRTKLTIGNDEYSPVIEAEGRDDNVTLTC